MKHLTNTELMEKFGTVANYSVLGGELVIISYFINRETYVRHVGVFWSDRYLLLEERPVQSRGYLARWPLHAGHSDNCIDDRSLALRLTN